MLKLKRTLKSSPIGLSGYAKLLGISNKTLYNKLKEADAIKVLETKSYTKADIS